jgi:ribosomal protein S18 acetylase RimI-like enzyme
MGLELKKITKNFESKDELSKLLISFRAFLAQLKNKKDKMSIKEGIEEIDYYLDKDFPIYAAYKDNQLAGYFILKYDDDAVWLEHFYVKKEFRKQGIGSALFKKAEEEIENQGYVNLYNWVHPNNDRMINFLKKQGYDVLNMIEIRKKFTDEKLQSEVSVDNNKFKYN